MGAKYGQNWRYFPIACCINLVEVFSADFAVVVLGQQVFGDNTHAETMLPNFADVTLDEKASQIVRELDGEYWLEVNCVSERVVLGIVVEGRQTRVVVVATNTAD